MRVLMVSDYFPPEIGSAPFLFYELAKNLVGKGDEVSVVTGFPRYNIDKKELDHKYQKRFLLSEVMDGINIFRIRTFSLPRKVNIFRGVDQFLTAFIYFLRALLLKDYDCILIYSPPLSLGLAGYFLRIIKRKRSILNVQDLFPRSAIDLGALKNKLLITFFEKLERFVYTKNDYVTVHSLGNKEHVLRMCGGDVQVAIVPNWVNTEEIRPGPKDNEFSKKYNLIGKFVVSFAGVLGESQDLDIILDAAKVLCHYKDIIFIIVGEGRKKQIIEKRKEVENIDNLIIIPMQPKDKYPLILHSSDIGLVTLKGEVKTPVVPSKILSIMASGIPVIASLPLNGDASSIITESGAGLYVEAGDTERFTQAIIGIYKNAVQKKKFGENGRQFVEKNYSLDICSKIYEGIFKKLNT